MNIIITGKIALSLVDIFLYKHILKVIGQTLFYLLAIIIFIVPLTSITTVLLTLLL